MKHNKHSLLALCSIVAASVALACSSGETGSGDGNEGGAPATGGLTSGSGGAPLGSGGAASGGGPDGGLGGDTGTGGDGSGSGGEVGSGGTTGTGGDSGNGKNPPVPSAGCGKALGTLRSGVQRIRSSNLDREFTIDIPTNYDQNKPYRLIFTWHWINARDDDVVNGSVHNGGPVWAYYGLKNQANTAGDPAIFIAPQSRNGRWDQVDHVFFDDMLALAKEQLCVDTSRVFATGFSFGGMQTYSLSLGKKAELRAVAALAPANFNIYLPPNDSSNQIAYMSVTGMSDTLTPWDQGNNRGARYAALGHARDNGCTIPNSIPTTSSGSRTYQCYDFEGCDAGSPVKVCTFDGGHIAAHADGGTGDDGARTWIPGVTWEFFTQF